MACGDAPTNSPDLSTLEAAISPVLASRCFRRSEQLRRLLSHLIQAVGSPDSTLLSETAIGVQVFGRKDFNPKLDTIVRAEMLRLRRKLDEYYLGEGKGSALRIGFERNSYRPILVPNVRAEGAPAETAAVGAGRGWDRPFWLGAAAGGGTMGVLALAAALLLVPPGAPRLPKEVREHPLWRGFRSTDVEVLIGSPLFFRNESGFERNLELNTPEDLPLAQERLARWPAYPYWEHWAPFQDIPAAVLLDRALVAMGSNVTVVAARQRSIANLGLRRTLIVGHPRFAPLLENLLAQQNFRMGVHATGQKYGGFLNAAPRAGEAPFYSAGSLTLAQRSDENTPDYALVTSLQLEHGGEALSIFGDRVQSAGYVARALLEPNLLNELNGKVFTRPAARHKSAQVVFRVDYSRGIPIGLVYVTHRIAY